ncbi:restriction endonuclease subunit S [Rhizorhabdus histidinilytica]|uniref:restriction endonuclease subunit S n=1 Tax=Rhizorhabdus histidinilytica TaxID=439228 RepID=UPI001ADBBEE9|nr:restriction endonuclease subunit S [Rhizorhabdus histidinilytica]
MTSADDEGRGVLPKLRFPEFRDAGEWAPASLGQFLTESRIVGGKGDSARKLTVKLWGGGVFAKNEARSGSENTQYYKRSAGQFIYSKLDFLNQAFGIIPAHLDGLESTVDLPCFDIGAGLSPKFLLEYVQRDQFFRRNGELADGGRKAKRIQVEDFLSFSINLPPLPAEQKKIAECLSSFDDLIEAEGERLAALRKYKNGLMQQLFPRPERIENGEKIPAETTPRLRFPEFRNAGKWEPRSLGAISVMKAGSYIAAADIVEFPSDGLYPCYGGNGLRGYARTHTHNGRYSLIGRQGALCGNVNFVAGKFHATEHAVVVTPDANVSNEWLYHALVQLNLNRFATGQAQPGLSVEILERVDCTTPRDKREQQAVADSLSAADVLISTQEQRLAALKLHKSGLMQQLFPSPSEASA